MNSRLSAAACVCAAAGRLAAAGPAYAAEGPELLAAVRNAPLVIRAETPDGRGQCGEAIRFRVEPVAPPAGAVAVRVSRWVNFYSRKVEDHPVSAPFAVTMSSAVPAHLAVTGVYVDAAGNEIAPPPVTGGYGDGVLIAPDGLPVARPMPPDFREFWAGELRKLAALPMRVVSRVEVARDAGRKVEDVEVFCGKIPVKGYLVTPAQAAPRSLPAVVCFHGAGFKSASERREFGPHAIVFDVNAHGIPNGMPPEYYARLNRNPPPDRQVYANRDDREKNYFKDMFLRTVRAVDFVRSLPEWDGRTLIVFGRSQGGAQALAAAALASDVTLCIANVPALADHAGARCGRQPGWPQLNFRLDPAVAAAADYIDVVNLAALIRCETRVSLGLIDRICAPASVYLTYRAIPHERKSLALFPRLGHNAPPPEADGRRTVIKELSK